MKDVRRCLFILFLPLVVTTGGCSYSFTGASIAPEVKTFSVDYFPNFTQLGPPLLSQLFTEKLKDLFLAQTSLKLVERNGDLRFEGKITNYRTAPVAIQANDKAASNRLTITVLVKFINNNLKDCLIMDRNQWLRQYLRKRIKPSPLSSSHNDNRQINFSFL